MDKLKDWQTDIQMAGQINGLKDGRHIYGQTDRQIDGQTDRQADRRTDRQDRQTDRQTDIQTDRQSDIFLVAPSFT